MLAYEVGRKAPYDSKHRTLPEAIHLVNVYWTHPLTRCCSGYHKFLENPIGTSQSRGGINGKKQYTCTGKPSQCVVGCEDTTPEEGTVLAVRPLRIP